MKDRQIHKTAVKQTLQQQTGERLKTEGEVKNSHSWLSFSKALIFFFFLNVTLMHLGYSEVITNVFKLTKNFSEIVFLFSPK